MHNVFFDIETIPTQLESLKEDLKHKVKPPGNLKKKESIDNWYTEKYNDAYQEAYKKLALDGGYNHIISIGVSIDEDEPVVFYANTYRQERTIIEEFYNYIAEKTTEFERRYVGHNIIGFDLPVLRKRSMVHGVKMDILPMNVKPWETKVYDTMLRWDPKNYISLDDLTKVLGLPISKTKGFDGSKVYGAWKNGEHTKIAQYTIQDVKTTIAAATTMMKADGII